MLQDKKTKQSTLIKRLCKNKTERDDVSIDDPFATYEVRVVKMNWCGGGNKLAVENVVRRKMSWQCAVVVNILRWIGSGLVLFYN